MATLRILGSSQDTLAAAFDFNSEPVISAPDSNTVFSPILKTISQRCFKAADWGFQTINGEAIPFSTLTSILIQNGGGGTELDLSGIAWDFTPICLGA